MPTYPDLDTILSEVESGDLADVRSAADAILDDPRELVIDAKTGRPRHAGADVAEGEYIMQFRRDAEASLYVFTKGILVRDYLTPTLHRPFCDWLQTCPPYRKAGLLPREHAKSSIVSHGLPLHILIQPDDANLYFPGESGANQRVLLACETEGRGKDHLRVMASAMEANDIFRGFWPHRCWENPRRESKKWNDVEVIIPRASEFPDPSIRVIGVGGAITGAHPTVVIKDDLVTLEAMNSVTVMQGAIEWHITSRALTNRAGTLEFIIGCLPGDATILLEDGTRSSMNDVKVGDRVWAADTNGSLTVRVVEDKIFQGIAETMTISTVSKILRATLNHPFLVRRKRTFEWVRADALNVDDFLVSIKSIPGTLVYPWMTEGFCWLFGFLLGDGWVNGRVRRGYVCVAVGKNEDLNARVLTEMQEWWPSDRYYRTPFGYMRLDNGDVARALEDLGLVGSAKTKRVPAWAFQLPPSYRQAFLKGFCEADGHLMEKGIETYRIETSNGPLLEDLRHLALLCGVRTGVLLTRTREVKAPNSAHAIYSTTWHSGFNFATVNRCEMYHGAHQFPSDDGLRQERITSIERNAIVEPVYDLTVAGTPSFFANGLAVHNTRWHAADLYAYIQQNDPSVVWVIRSIVENGHRIYPEIFSEEKVAELQRDFGVLFPLLYMNSAADPSLVDFSVSDLRDYDIVNGAITFQETSDDLRLVERLHKRPDTPSDVLRGAPLNADTFAALRLQARRGGVRMKVR